MSQEFVPETELEKMLVKAQTGAMPNDEFRDILFKSNVFMPVLDEESEQSADDQATPLTLQTEDGKSVIALFTSPERARDFLGGYPGYEGGLVAEFKWIVEKLGVGVGITLNPQMPVGLDLESEAIQNLMDNKN